MHNYGRYHPFLGAALYTPAAVPWNVSDNPAQFHSQGGNFPVNDENRYWAGGGTLTSHSTMFHISLTQEEQGRLVMRFRRMRRPPLARGEGDQNFTRMSLTNHIVKLRHMSKLFFNQRDLEVTCDMRRLRTLQ